MTTSGLILGLYCIFFAALIIGISIPLYLGKVKKNRWYGVRIPKAFTSDDNWYKINRYGGKRMIIWSIPLAVLGIATLFFPFAGHTDGHSHMGIPLLLVYGHAPMIVLIPIVEILIYARKL